MTLEGLRKESSRLQSLASGEQTSLFKKLVDGIC